jgi:predicted ATPase
MKEEDTHSLADLIWKKTDGNPFYAISFLDMLHNNGLINQDMNERWSWDEEKVLLQTNVADNLTSVLKIKLRRIPTQARSVLQIASFIGYEFSAIVLTNIFFEEQDLIQGEFSFERLSMQVIQDQVVNSLTLASSEGLLETTADQKVYKFAHDKIRDVLYDDLMPDSLERQHLHRRIGFLIRESLNGEDLHQEIDKYSIFLAANNLNRAIDLIDNVDERYDTILLNFKAGKVAMNKLDFSLASEYLRVAINLIKTESSWDSHYELTIKLFSIAAEVEKINSCYERSNDLTTEILNNATSLQHRCAAYEIRLNSLAAKGDIKASVYFGSEILRELGVKFPAKIGIAVLLKNFSRRRLHWEESPCQNYWIHKN